MISFVKLSGIMAAAGLAGAAVTAAAPTAQAQTMAGPVKVPCDAGALATAITNANGIGGGTVILAAACTYNITTPATATDGLPVITGNVHLVGGQGTTITRPAGPLFRILEVAAGGSLSLSNTVITNGNTAGFGGGILNTGTLTLNQVFFSGNTAGSGGAVSNSAGATAQVFSTTMRANTTIGPGGGGISNAGMLTLSGSSISKNSASANGGGVLTLPSGSTRIVGSSIFSNTAVNGFGGGIDNAGTTSLDGSTVQTNTAVTGGGIFTSNNNVTLRNSIVTNNTPSNCAPPNTIPGCVN